MLKWLKQSCFRWFVFLCFRHKFPWEVLVRILVIHQVYIFFQLQNLFCYFVKPVKHHFKATDICRRRFPLLNWQIMAFWYKGQLWLSGLGFKFPPRLQNCARLCPAAECDCTARQRSERCVQESTFSSGDNIHNALWGHSYYNSFTMPFNYARKHMMILVHSIDNQKQYKLFLIIFRFKRLIDMLERGWFVLPIRYTFIFYNMRYHKFWLYVFCKANVYMLHCWWLGKCRASLWTEQIIQGINTVILHCDISHWYSHFSCACALAKQ